MGEQAGDEGGLESAGMGVPGQRGEVQVAEVHYCCCSLLCLYKMYM